jgi:hypothetical protein
MERRSPFPTKYTHFHVPLRREQRSLFPTNHCFFIHISSRWLWVAHLARPKKPQRGDRCGVNGVRITQVASCQTRSAWIDISKLSLCMCSGFGNPLRAVIFSPYLTHFAWLRLWGCGNSRCSILLHQQICVNPRNFDNLNGLSQRGAGKRPYPLPLMVR